MLNRPGIQHAVLLAATLLAGAAYGQDDLAPELVVVQPPSATAGTQVQTGAPDVYEVVSGDTLWEICTRFFGDAQYWPTLWSINNEEVTNPHYIYPGQRLRFTAGSDVRPPAVAMGDSSPLLEDLSFDENFKPVVHFLASNRDCAVHVPFGTDQKLDVTLHAPNFVARSPVQALGSIEAAPASKVQLTAGDLVYMKFRNPNDVNCGDIYSLYHPVKELTHPEVRSARLGHVYLVSAEVMVTDVSDKWVTGKILQAYSELTRGELVTDRVPVTGQVRALRMSQDLDGYVVDKANNENLLMQRNQVIYIDRGRADGVQSGTTFWVVRRGDGLTFRSDDDDTALPDEVIGRLVVFSADEHVSTAVMTEQAVDVEVGDRITSRLN